MEYLLFIAGVALVTLGFLMEHPKFKEKFTNPMIERSWQLEEQRIQQLRQATLTAREDVAALLVELERASEAVVASIDEKIRELREESIAKEGVASVTREGENRQELSRIIREKAKEAPMAVKKKPRVKKLTVEVNEERQEEIELTGRQATVLSLSRQGHSPGEIARLLQMGQGEVELILGLKTRGD